MDIDLIMKVAGMCLLITAVCQVMSRAGRDEQSTLLSISGTIIILIMIAERVGELVMTLKRVFGI